MYQNQTCFSSGTVTVQSELLQPNINLIMELMRSIGIGKIIVEYSGGGDEGSTLCFNKPGYFIETLVSIDEIDSYAMEYGYTDFMLLFYRVMWFRLSILFIKGFVNQNFTVRGLDKLLKVENIAIGHTPTTRLTYLLRSMVAKICVMQLSKKGLTTSSQMSITGNINAYITDILNRWKSYSLEAFISRNRLSVNWRV